MRVHNWSLRLAETFEKAEKQSFVYGTFDCALFAADCVLAVTGVDYAADLRGYTSKIDAYRIVAGYGSLEAMITTLLNREPVHPAFAGRCDVVLGTPRLREDETGECIGICTGVLIAYPKEVGLTMQPRSTALRTWRIE